MKVVTQTNAVKSPTDSPATTKLVYTVNDIELMGALREGEIVGLTPEDISR